MSGGGEGFPCGVDGVVGDAAFHGFQVLEWEG